MVREHRIPPDLATYIYSRGRECNFNTIQNFVGVHHSKRHTRDPTRKVILFSHSHWISVFAYFSYFVPLHEEQLFFCSFCLIHGNGNSNSERDRENGYACASFVCKYLLCWRGLSLCQLKKRRDSISIFIGFVLTYCNTNIGKEIFHYYWIIPNGHSKVSLSITS